MNETTSAATRRGRRLGTSLITRLLSCRIFDGINLIPVSRVGSETLFPVWKHNEYRITCTFEPKQNRCEM